MQVTEKAKEGVSVVKKMVDETILEDQKTRVAPVRGFSRAERAGGGGTDVPDPDRAPRQRSRGGGGALGDAAHS